MNGVHENSLLLVNKVVKEFFGNFSDAYESTTASSSSAPLESKPDDSLVVILQTAFALCRLPAKLHRSEGGQWIETV
jgi:hypothetical protein